MTEEMLKCVAKVLFSIVMYLSIRDPQSELLGTLLKMLRKTFHKELKESQS